MDFDDDEQLYDLRNSMTFWVDSYISLRENATKREATIRYLSGQIQELEGKLEVTKTVIEQRDRSFQENADLRQVHSQLKVVAEDYGDQISELKESLDKAHDALKVETEVHVEREKGLRKTADELRDELKELRQDVKDALPTAEEVASVPLVAALAGFSSVEEALNARFKEGWDAALADARVVVEEDNKVLANDLVEVEEFTLLPYEDRYRVAFKDGRVLFGLKHLAAHYISLGLILKRRAAADDPEEKMAEELAEEMKQEYATGDDIGRWNRVAQRAMQWAREQ